MSGTFEPDCMFLTGVVVDFHSRARVVSEVDGMIFIAAACGNRYSTAGTKYGLREI